MIAAQDGPDPRRALLLGLGVAAQPGLTARRMPRSGRNGPVRALIQRVNRARSRSTTRSSGRSGRGCASSSGSPIPTTRRSPAKLAERVWNLRVFDDEGGFMNVPVAEAGGEVLVVSQFTLYGDTQQGAPAVVGGGGPAGAGGAADRAVHRGAGRPRGPGGQRPVRRPHARRARERRAGHGHGGGLTDGHAAWEQERLERRSPGMEARRPTARYPFPGERPETLGPGRAKTGVSDGTHRFVPQHLAVRHGADALPPRPERDQHRHAGARERLGAVLRPGDFPGIRGLRRGAEPVPDPPAAVVAPHRAVRALRPGDGRPRRHRRGLAGRGHRVARPADRSGNAAPGGGRDAASDPTARPVVVARRFAALRGRRGGGRPPRCPGHRGAPRRPHAWLRPGRSSSGSWPRERRSTA